MERWRVGDPALGSPRLPRALICWSTNRGEQPRCWKVLARLLPGALKAGGGASFRVHVNLHGETAVTPLDETKEAALVEPGDAELAAALAEARQRGAARAAEILASPDMLGADAFASLLGTTRATVNTWRRNNQVLALRGAKRGFRYPAWQVSKEGKPFAALPALFERLGGAWGVYIFLVRRQPEFNGLTGVEALQRGRTTMVIDAADAVAQGAFT